MSTVVCDRKDCLYRGIETCTSGRVTFYQNNCLTYYPRRDVDKLMSAAEIAPIKCRQVVK